MSMHSIVNTFGMAVLLAGAAAAAPLLLFSTGNPDGLIGTLSRPASGLSSGNFLWLSAPRPIVAPGTPFTGDLQAWIRNTNLDPAWLRIGTDIVGGTTPPTFNMTFSLQGDPVPEPSGFILIGTALTFGACGRKYWRSAVLRCTG